MRSIALVPAALALTLTACPREAPPEPTRPDTPAMNVPSAAAAPPPAPVATDTGGAAPAAAPKPGGDPLDGKFTLADATKDLKGSGALLAKIETAKGTITCKLYEDKAPTTVANFVGLARGIRPFKDPVKKEWVTRPWYDGTVFHRIIKGFMIQGGDPLGNGSGEPGYTIKDEIWPGMTHDKVGQICMANRGPNTNGGQFFIMDAPTTRLDGNYTIFGECKPEQTVHDIANGEVMGDRAKSPVTIKTVTIAREK